MDAAPHEVGRVTGLGVLAGALVLVGAAAAARPRTLRRLAPDSPASRPRRRTATGDPLSTLPDVIDLLALAADAGLPVAGAVAAAATWSPQPWRAALEGCVAACAGGSLLHDALGRLDDVDAGAGPLVAVLRAGLADGDGLVAGLRRLATDARDARHRRAEERARALPVRLLLPLVGCSLPAFVVLTIVPILAGALRGLRLPAAP
jgi:Flp pilus assembly protein TadB